MTTDDRRVILDMDSSESPVHGEQEGASYNGHFGSTCYHPLFVFNQFGDCEGAMLRGGNVHSAHRRRDVLDALSPHLAGPEDDKMGMKHGSRRETHLYWIGPILNGLAGPEYHAAISFGLPIEPEDSQIWGIPAKQRKES